MYTYLLFKETNNHYKENYFLAQKYKINFNVIWIYNQPVYFLEPIPSQQ